MLGLLTMVGQRDYRFLRKGCWKGAVVLFDGKLNPVGGSLLI